MLLTGGGAVGTLCLRFDVDSHRCLLEGVPNLLDLLGRLGVPATFFVNMGRLTSRPRMLARRLSPGRRLAPKQTLPLSAKLGRKGMLRVMATNPRVGAGAPQQVAAITAAGHEVGLHGGRSHRRWQDDAPGWTAQRVGAEVDWGLARLAEAGVPAPGGFSSPGWATSDVVADVVADRGFTYLVDAHGHGTARPGRLANGLVSVPTNLVGEPGGVGYLEWHRARRHDDAAILADFRQRLRVAGDLAVVYDHPFHAGVADLAAVGRLVEVARGDGWELATMGTVAAGA